jgi:hypothetical protein
VTQNRAGAASGINNAISQTSALLAIAISAPIFFACFRVTIGISERQLERRSLLFTGVPPKDLSRISRFQRAIKSHFGAGTRTNSTS